MYLEVQAHRRMDLWSDNMSTHWVVHLKESLTSEGSSAAGLGGRLRVLHCTYSGNMYILIYYNIESQMQDNTTYNHNQSPITILLILRGGSRESVWRNDRWMRDHA